MLNSAQRSAFDSIVTSLRERRDEVNTKEARCFFVDGPGGTGKTFLYETLYYYCVVEGFKCIVTAWTGISASLLPTGRTVHSTFKLPLNLTETATCNVRMNSADGQKLEEADIILWDECSMAESRALTAVMVMGGDFRQILLVVQYGDRSHILEKCVLENACWPLFRSLKLHRNERAAISQKAFATHLNDVGEGRTNNELGLHVFNPLTQIRLGNGLFLKTAWANSRVTLAALVKYTEKNREKLRAVDITSLRYFVVFILIARKIVFMEVKVKKYWCGSEFRVSQMPTENLCHN
uniref:ATP-dependent DNA helicase n=1 Tax=Phlebotomus papatasi TaxID=29031 RepID=A0A1B0DLN1_PHLPP